MQVLTNKWFYTKSQYVYILKNENMRFPIGLEGIYTENWVTYKLYFIFIKSSS